MVCDLQATQPCVTQGYTASQAEGEVEQLIREGNIFALVSHQFWGVWCLIQARYSAIDFDYMEYCSVRWNEYQKRKSAFMSKHEQHIF